MSADTPDPGGLTVVMARLIGRRHTMTHRVVAADTAAHWGNELEVLATPVLLWLSEIASMRVADDHLPDGWMSLGLAHDSQHTAPTSVGVEVEVAAELIAVGHNKLTYRVKATDDRGTILRGQHSRGLVERKDFLRRLAQVS